MLFFAVAFFYGVLLKLIIVLASYNFTSSLLMLPQLYR